MYTDGTVARQLELACRRRRVNVVLLMAVLAAASIAAGVPAADASPPTSPDSAGTRTVIIEGMSFHPTKVVVRRGERIRWINKDPFPHTVTAVNGRFDSGTIRPDGTWTYVPGKSGELDYRCAFHATMKGKIIVR